MRALALFLVATLAGPALAGCMGLIPELRNPPTAPGALAADYLQDRYSQVEFVLRAEAGAVPNPKAVEDAVPVLEEAIGKPVRVRVIEAGVEAKGENGRYTVQDLVDLEAGVREEFTGGETAVIHGLYLAGKMENDRVLGVAYRGSSLAFFKGTIRNASSSDDCAYAFGELRFNRCELPGERYVERAVLVHEVGHLLGLVNNGVPMVEPHEQTQDPKPETEGNEGEGHSSNRESVMYWAIESASDLPEFLGPARNFFENGDKIPYRFDDMDLADLRAFAAG